MQSPTPYHSTFELLARISKTKGLDGQLVAQPLSTLSVLRPGIEVWIVPPTHEGIRHTTISQVIESVHKQGVALYLEGVDTRTQAAALTDRYLLASRDQLTPSHHTQRLDEVTEQPTSEDITTHDTVFFDENYGNLGTLMAMKPGPAYDIWVVNGPYGQLEIPAVDAYMVDETDASITLALPEGFIEITSIQPKKDE